MIVLSCPAVTFNGPQKNQIYSLDRRTQTTIFRLQTGHCGLRKHLKRLGLADSDRCECGSERQTPEHILEPCQHMEIVRQQFWPEHTEMETKLWGGGGGGKVGTADYQQPA